MGFWKEMFSNMDEPALMIQWYKSDNEEIGKLKEENRKLKLIIKRIIEQSGTEEKRLKKIAAECYLLE